ncbi:MAG: tetratricopeptide repeat protein [Candidatus Omnitrophica bacterium]|nr:tetratricopeptide repeat protein [Candidatus Omnitrophota bacterium]
MQVSPAHLFGHLVCSALLVALAFRYKTSKAWAFFFGFLFFISEPAVFLIWGPWRLYGVYAAAFAFFLGAAFGTGRFYIFLKTQEALVRYFFWAAVVVFALFVASTSVAEISLRRDALTFWTHEVKMHPTAPNLDHLADAYDFSGDFLKAKGYYRQAAVLDPKSPKAYEGLAGLAQAQGDWASAVGYFQKVIALVPRRSSAYLGLGEAFRKSGDSRHAVETYSRLLDLFPDDENIDMKVIEAYGRAIADNPRNSLYKEKREEALEDLDELSRRKNYKAVDYYNLAFLYDQVGGKEEAQRYYTKAVQMQPDYKQALYNLANLYRDAGNFKMALGFYERLIHFHPKFASAYLDMGKIFSVLGDRPRARLFLLKAIDLDPACGDAYFNLGYLSESQGDRGEAVNYYEKAVEVAPKNAEAYYNLGNVYAGLGQNSEAIASYLKAVALNPRHQNAFVNLSILSFKSGDFQGAIHYLEQAQALGYNPPAEYLKTLEPYRK